MDVERIAARVWPGRRVEVEPLGGGITNRNFRVDCDGRSYVLRIGGKDTHLLGIDRRAEYRAASVAAALGVGPEVVAFVEPEGYLVTRFVEGAPAPPEELRRPEALRETAALLRRIHDGPADPGAVRLVPRRRGLPRERGRARRRGAGARTTRRRRSPTGSRRRWARGRRRRATTTC